MAQSDIEHPGWRLTIWPRKWARTREAPAMALAPYHSLNRNWLKKIFGIFGLMLFCLIYGFFFSVFVPNLAVLFLSPILVLTLLVIWALPDINKAPTLVLERLFYATLIALIVWPNYLAISVSSLPWITILRLTTFPLDIILLICISISSEFRARLNQSLRAIPTIPILLTIFVAIQFLSIGLSKDTTLSVQKFVVAQTSWTAVFFVSAYVFLKPGQIKRWAIILWIMAIFVSLIAIWEFRIERLPWVGHIPGFLKINDDAVEAILSAKMRAGTTLYRAQSTFSTPLGLAEYLALTLPFVLHFATARFPQKMRAAAIFSIPVLLIACYLTNAKLGMVGCLFDILIYIFITAFQTWKRNRNSLIAASFLFSYPASLGIVSAAMLFSHRFQVLILGTDGSHTNSTEARIQQWTVGFQKLLEWPFGYGIGMGAATINPGAISGRITIDTYYLSILLEYGIAGFIIYYGMFAVAIYEGTRRSFLAPSADEDKSFLLPISVSLITFIVIKSVFSQQDNHPVVFMMLGALVALISLYRKMPARLNSTIATRTIEPSRPKRSRE